MTELRRKASEIGHEIANEVTNKLWADPNTELKDLRAEVARLRAGGSGAVGDGETARGPKTRLQ